MTDAPFSIRVENALFALLAERPFAAVGIADVAERAEVGLADLRRTYDGPLDILAGFSRRIDAAVLEGGAEAAGETRRERLFDALMRRFDLLHPHRAGIAGLARAARRDPGLACRLAPTVVGSQRWLLAAAGFRTGGPVGRLRAVGLAAALARLAPVFLAEEDASLPKTMAALDRTLSRLSRLEGWAERIERGVCRRAVEPTPAASEAAVDPAI